MVTDAINPLVPAAYDIAWSTVAVIMLLLTVTALISIARTVRRITSAQALVWTLVAIFIPVLGALSWFFIGRRFANQALDTAHPAP